MAYPYRIVLQALAYFIGEVARMKRVAKALGYEATVRDPQGLMEQLAAVERGERDSIGENTDAFELVGHDGRALAYYRLVASEDGGLKLDSNMSAEFGEAYAAAIRDESGPTH